MKISIHEPLAARLKSCPDTIDSLKAILQEAPMNERGRRPTLQRPGGRATFPKGTFSYGQRTRGSFTWNVRLLCITRADSSCPAYLRGRTYRGGSSCFLGFLLFGARAPQPVPIAMPTRWQVDTYIRTADAGIRRRAFFRRKGSPPAMAPSGGN